jgi:hypothetical protein
MKLAVWFRTGLTAAALSAIGSAAIAAPSGVRATATGDALLTRAVAAPHLRSYSVPVHMTVHVHKPIGIRTQVDATAYFRAPAQAALVITHASGLAGAFFKSAYKIDLVPQAWPSSYHVVSTAHAVAGGVPVIELTAEPRTAVNDLVQVVFTLSTPALQPIAAEWQYTGGSSIRLAFVNGRVGAYTLPQQATIEVNMPHDDLDASGTYSSYALNAPVPPDVFSAAK